MSLAKMDRRDRLAKYVESELSKREQEAGIQFFGDANSFQLISYSPPIVRIILRHEYAEIEWCYVTCPDHLNRREKDIAEISPVEGADRIEGVCADVPLGALSIKGSPRGRDIPSGIVTTPEDIRGLDDAFESGGGDSG